ncbi:MAG: glycosyltransferase family 39 protein [Methanobrevibacter sp.]|nr:glycosyltransferase family 39 protein [Candidatus Methanoflexus mossambicus]
MSLIFLTIFSMIISFFIIYINSNFNTLTGVDVYLYLMYSLKFAGFNVGYDYIIPNLSPLIPFLNSLVFRLGFISEDSIIVITGLFYILGVISSYFLFHLRYNNLISTLGAVLFGTFFIVLFSIANGCLDIPCISLSILAIYLILKRENNKKYFYLGSIVLALAFLAKFTALLIIMVVLIHFLSKEDFIENFKKYIKTLLTGLILFILTITPYMTYLILNYNDPLAFLSYAEAMGVIEVKPEIFQQLFFYIYRIPYIIASHNLTIAYIFLTIVLIGIIVLTYKFILKQKNTYNSINNFKNNNNNNNNNNNDNDNENSFRITKENILLTVSLILIIFSFILTYFIPWKFTEILFFIAILIFSYSFTKIKNNSSDKTLFKFFNIDLTMFSWFFVYLIFFTTRITKGDRYFISFLPPFIFILLFFINELSNEFNKLKTFILKGFTRNNLYFNKNSNKIKNSSRKLKNNIKNNMKNIIKNKMKSIDFKKIIPILLIILFLFSTISFLSINRHQDIIDNEKETVIWLKNYDTHYNDKVIISDSPFYTFYLKKEISLLTEDVNSNNIADFLKNKNASYFISNLNRSKNINGYTVIKTIGKVTVYEKIRILKI